MGKVGKEREKRYARRKLWRRMKVAAGFRRICSAVCCCWALFRSYIRLCGQILSQTAYSNIAVNTVCVMLCLIAVYRENLIALSFRFEKSFLRKYGAVGLFSGAQILLDNLIYAAIVCKMVNQVAEQGNYWVANNIIWGLLLIPISALAEIIKKESRGKVTLKDTKHYNIIIIAVFLIWLCFIPLLNPFLKNVMGIENYGEIRRILVLLIPFYLAYSYTVLFDNILIGNGKTQYCFITSGIVNLVYYPIVYGLMLKGVFATDMTFICMMFGFGMVVHLGCSVVCFLIYNRRYMKKEDCGNAARASNGGTV